MSLQTGEYTRTDPAHPGFCNGGFVRFDGMGGECIWGCACWVVVPHAAIRGEEAAATPNAVAESLADPEPIAPFVNG